MGNPSIADLGTFVTTGQPQRGLANGMWIPSDDQLRMMSKFDEFAKLTAISGGKSFFPRSAAEMAEIFSRLGTELRFQYTLGVKISNASVKKQPHRLKVKVKPPRGAPNVFVRNREEFFVY